MNKIKVLLLSLTLFFISTCQIENSTPQTKLDCTGIFTYGYMSNYNLVYNSCDVRVSFIDPILDINGNEITEIVLPDYDVEKLEPVTKRINIQPIDTVLTKHRFIWIANYYGIEHIVKDTLQIVPNTINRLVGGKRLGKNPEIAESSWYKSGNRVYYDVWVKNYSKKDSIIPVFEITVYSNKGTEVGSYEVESKAFISSEEVQKYKVSTKVKYPEIVSTSKIKISKVKYE